MLTDSNNEQKDESPVFDPNFNSTEKSEKLFYYCYDKNGNYTDAVYSDNQPEESTKIPPVNPYVNSAGHAVEGITVGMTNPKWDGNMWIEQAQSAVPQGQQLAQLALQQAQFQASQQKLNSQLALQLAQITVKEGK